MTTDIVDLAAWRQKQAGRKEPQVVEDVDALFIGVDGDNVIVGVSGAELVIELTEDGARQAATLLLKGAHKLRVQRNVSKAAAEKDRMVIDDPHGHPLQPTADHTRASAPVAAYRCPTHGPFTVVRPDDDEKSTLRDERCPHYAAPFHCLARSPRLWMPQVVPEHLSPPTRVFVLMPDPGFLVEWRRDNEVAARWEDTVYSWWYLGIEITLTAKDDVDPLAAWSHLRAISRSAEPSRTHKIRALAYLASCWFEGPPC